MVSNGVTYGESSTASDARAASASEPSAATVITVDNLIVRPSSEMRLLASASRSPLRMTMRLANRLAAWTKRAAGRAWSPAASMTVIRISGICLPAWRLRHRRRADRGLHRGQYSPLDQGRLTDQHPRLFGLRQLIQRHLDAKPGAAQIEQHQDAVTVVDGANRLDNGLRVCAQPSVR